MSFPIVTPLVRSVGPSYSPLRGGVVVHVYGDYFQPGCVVRFGSRFTTTQFVHTTYVYAISPPQSAPGAYPVVVVNPGDRAGGYPYFYYVAPPGPVTVTAPTGGQTIQTYQQVTAQWTTNGPASSHTVRLAITGRTPIVLASNLPGTARSHVFTAPNPGASPVQAAVQVLAYNSLGESSQGNSQPFTLLPPPKTKEKDKDKDKEKEFLAEIP